MRTQKKLSSFFTSSSTGTGLVPSLKTKERREDDASSFSPSLKRPRSHHHVAKDIRSSRSGGSRFQECIICNKSFPAHTLIHHAAKCNGITALVGSSNSTHENDNNTMSVGNTKKRNNSKHSTSEPCTKTFVKFNISKENTNSSNLNKTNSMTQSSNSKSRVETSERTQLLWKDILNNNAEITDKGKNITSSEPIPGLFIFENFITEEEENHIINLLDLPSSKNYWKQARFNGQHKGKKWGVNCNLRDKRVYKEVIPMPSFITDLIIPKLKELKCMKGCIPNEANAIDYHKNDGDYLKSHVDDRQLSKEPIANLSLGGDCFMTFRNEKKKIVSHDGKSMSCSDKVLLKRRTLQVLTRGARYDYSHGITNQDLISERRISITMRQSPLTKN